MIRLLFILLTCTPPTTISFRPQKIYKSQPRTQLCLKETFIDANPMIASTDSYKDLIQHSNMFIDKSLFIRDLVMNTAQATVFSTPPGWGKTTILDMLRTFFEFKLDHEYEIDRNRTAYDTYALFTKGEVTWTSPSQALLTPLLISDYEDTIDRHFGRYPVIYLSFKNVTGLNWFEIWAGIRNAVTEAFKQHAYMTKSIMKAICDLTKARDMMHKFEINLRQFQIYLSGSETRRVPMRKSIRFLSEMLNWYYHRQVFLFIDDFDIPLLNIFHYPHMLPRDITKLSSFLTDFYKETFRRNVHIKKSILTGTFSIENVTQFPPLVEKYNVITTPFPHVFGFTDVEIGAIFNRLKIPPEVRAQAQSWYNGYKVGLKLAASVYTPSSIVRFLNLGHLGNYYERRQKIDILEHLMNLKPLRFSFERLLSDHEIPVLFPKLSVDRFSLTELRTLIYKDFGDNFTVEVWQSAMGYLYAAGYLKAVSSEMFNNTQFIVLHTKLVNLQIREEVTDKLFSRYHFDYGVSFDMMLLAVNNLEEFAMNDDIDSLELARSLRFVYFSCDNLIVNETDEKSVEKTNHFLFSMLNYIFLTMRRMHQFSGQVFNELSRPDIVLWRGNRCVVMDIKFNMDYACSLLEQVKVYEDLEELINSYENIETVKFIAIDINPEKDVQICAQVRSISRR